MFCVSPERRCQQNSKLSGSLSLNDSESFQLRVSSFLVITTNSQSATKTTPVARSLVVTGEMTLSQAYLTPVQLSGVGHKEPDMV